MPRKRIRSLKASFRRHEPAGWHTLWQGAMNSSEHGAHRSELASFILRGAIEFRSAS